MRRGSLAATTWATLGQGTSSLSNFLLAVFVARMVSTVEFGTFSVGLLLITIGLGFARTFVGDALVIARGRTEEEEGSVVASAQASFNAISLALLVVFVPAVIVLREHLTIILSLAVVSPLVVLEDAGRYRFISSGDFRHAFLMDTVWLGAFLLTIGGAHLAGRLSGAYVILGWGLGAAIGIGYAIARERRWTASVRMVDWFRSNAQMLKGLGMEYVASVAGQHIVMLGIGLFLGLEALGALKAAHIVFGPISVLFVAALSFGVSEVGRRYEEGGSLTKDGVAVSGGLVFAAAIVGVVLIVLPDTMGVNILGETWGSAEELFPFVLAHKTGAAAGLGAVVALRVLGLTNLSGWGRMMGAGVMLLGVIVGGSLFDIEGAAAGIALGMIAASIALWVLYFRR